jgi:predicted TIM-barrel fold metal-dependent hydrolase
VTLELNEAELSLLDRTLDCDAHEMAPSHMWGTIFGPNGGRIAELAEPMLRKLGDNKIFNPDRARDELDISHENVWNVRGTDAPGAFDFNRRLAVMDKMGIKRQLIFPTFALTASGFATGHERKLRVQLGLTQPTEEIHELGRAGVREYNEWVLRATKFDPDRLRAVAYVLDNGTVQDLFDQTQSLIDRGARAINLASGSPPGGVSPADPALDPYWAMLEKRNVPAVLHVGNEHGFLKSSVWGRAPAFAPGKVVSTELGLEPYSFATLHLAASHFVTTMVLGGVFERFPGLRFGVIETGCIWFGPMAESLDMWARDVYSVRLKPFISMLPSQYLARNVRVTPFNNFEPIAEHLRRYPHLQDCYCYSTDYPHIEGGKNIKAVFAEKVKPLGYEVMEKFFAKNAEWLMPDDPS